MTRFKELLNNSLSISADLALDKIITEDEVYEAIKKMSNGKAAGIDKIIVKILKGG